jgi:hypothetical protein
MRGIRLIFLTLLLVAVACKSTAPSGSTMKEAEEDQPDGSVDRSEAGNARTVNLAATDGTAITLAYSLFGLNVPGQASAATNVVVRVANDAFGSAPAGHSIRAVLMSSCPSADGRNTQVYNRQIDISYTQLQSGSGFGYEVQLATFGDSVGSIPASTINGACHQQIAVVVDGAWLTDPVSGDHNFNFQFYR